jgi:hypothetical protein
MKTNKFFPAILSACFALVLSLQAQPSASTAVQQQNSLQQQTFASLTPGTNAPEIYPGEDADVGPQHILEVEPRRTMFEVKADSEYLWTDNALLTPVGEIASTIFVNTISATYLPTPYRLGNGRFAPYAGVSSQWYNYGLGGHDLSSVDFNAQMALVGGKYFFSNNWMAFGEFDYDRFLNQSNYREFYHDFTPIGGLQNLLKVGDNAVLATTLRADYHDSWTGGGLPADSEDRADGSVAISLNYLVTPKFVVEPYYRFQYTYYRFDTLHNTDRSDCLHSIGVSAAYYFLPSLSLRAFANGDVCQSNDPYAKYNAYSIGADLAYSIRF